VSVAWAAAAVAAAPATPLVAAVAKGATPESFATRDRRRGRVRFWVGSPRPKSYLAQDPIIAGKSQLRSLQEIRVSETLLINELSKTLAFF